MFCMYVYYDKAYSKDLYVCFFFTEEQGSPASAWVRDRAGFSGAQMAR